MQSKYWAFISYSHADERWAAWLHHQIETYRVPAKLVGRETGRGYTVPKRLFPAFRDRDELPSSADLGQNITRALRDSAYLVVICSPRAAVSRWVNEEVVTFKMLGGEDRILAFIVDGEPHASDKPECGLPECFPPALRHRIGPNRELLPALLEPIAADARHHADGKSRARLKLLSGILGVNFDELVQRDTQRRRRNLVRLFLLFAMLCVVAGAFLYYEEEKRQAQATEFHQQSQLKYASQALEKGRALFLAGNYEQALPYLAASWNINADPTGLRIMLNETLRNLQSIPYSGAAFAYGLNGGTFTPDGKSLLVWSKLDQAVRVLPVAASSHWREIDVSSRRQYSTMDLAVEDDVKTVFVARSGNQNKLGVFDVDTGDLMHDFDLPAVPIKLQLLHDHKRILVALKGGRIVTVDRDTGSISSELPAIETKNGLDIDKLTVSPDDKYLAVTDMTMTSLTVFDLTSGKQLWAAPGSGFMPPVAAFSPDSKKLLLMGQANGADVLDPATGQVQLHLDLGLKTLCPMFVSCAFRPDGAAAVFGTNSGRAFLYNFNTGAAITLPSESGTIPIVAFSRDGKIVLTGQNAIYLWGGSDGHLIYHCPRLQAVLAFASFNADALLAVAGAQNGQLRILRTDQPPAETVITSTSPTLPILFSAFQLVQPETGQMLSCDSDNSVTLHNTDGTTVKLADLPAGASAANILQILFSPKGGALALGFSDGTFGVWSTTDGRRIYGSSNLSNGSGLGGFALNDAEIAVLYWDGTLACIDFARGKFIGAIKDTSFANVGCTLEWSGGKVLACDGKSICRIFSDVTDPHPITVTSVDPVRAAHLSPDGKWLAIGTASGNVSLWNTATGQQAQSLASHPEGAVTLLKWSPTGKYLLTAENTDEVYLSDAATGHTLVDLGKIPQIQDACFTQNDKLILISLYNSTAVLMDRATNMSVTVWQVPGDLLGRVAANAAGTRFFANGSSRVYQWTVAPTVDMAALSNALSRDSLTLDNLDLRSR